MKAKFGVIDYRYNHARKFKRHLAKFGEYSINIGDCVQSLTVRLLLKRLGIHEDEIISVNRDSLSTYRGEPVRVVMNGCFYEHCFPLPPNVEPIFIGFNTSDGNLIRRNKEMFRKHEPIGCRDVSTTALFLKHGIKAFTTGCLTMTQPKREQAPAKGKVFVVGGTGPGTLPETLMSFMPEEFKKDAIHLTQRSPMNVFPMGDTEVHQAEAIAQGFLDRYRNEASLVVTPLLHAASPCLGMGVPVVLARIDHNTRFSAIRNIVPVYTPETFSSIQWAPGVTEVEHIKKHLIQLVHDHALLGQRNEESMKFLSGFYEKDLESYLASTPSPTKSGSKSALYKFLHFYWLRGRK